MNITVINVYSYVKLVVNVENDLKMIAFYWEFDRLMPLIGQKLMLIVFNLALKSEEMRKRFTVKRGSCKNKGLFYSVKVG